MLTKFKTRHIKKILWFLVIVIVPAFILWGSISFFSARKKSIIGKIENHFIKKEEFFPYIQLARIHLLITQGRNFSYPQLESHAWQFYILLWKAKKEGIRVKDEEVIKEVKKIFGEKKFDKQAYFNFLRRRFHIEPRAFEEYVRRRLMIEKLLKKFIKVKVKDEEILKLYKKDKEKAKISYLFIPYSRFKNISISQDEIEKFYQKNKALFKEEPKVKIRYLIFSKKDFKKMEKKIEKLRKKVKTIKELSKKLNRNYKESGYLTFNSPIEEIGWQPDLIRIAFSLPKNSLSKIIPTEKGYVILEKIDEKRERIPSFEEVKEKVKKKVLEEKVKKEAEKLGKEILEKIKEKNITDLKKLAQKYKLKYKETGFFKYYDYIEGLGLDRRLSEKIFSAKKGEILPQVFLLEKGAYIIKIEEILLADKKEFLKEKEKYRKKVYLTKELIEELKFFNQLIKELNVKIFSSFYPS